MTLAKIHCQAILITALTTAATLSIGAEAKQPQGPRNGPPKEAIDACSSLSLGDPCSFSGHQGSVEGSCIIPNNEESLVCAPEGGMMMQPPKRKQ